LTEAGRLDTARLFSLRRFDMALQIGRSGPDRQDMCCAVDHCKHTNFSAQEVMSKKTSTSATNPMPCILLPIDPVLAPTLEIGLSSSLSVVAAGAARPQIHWAKVIADAGCSHTSIPADIVPACGLKVLGKGSSNTAGLVPCNIYHGDLS
jgi:hypothetical protein